MQCTQYVVGDQLTEPLLVVRNDDALFTANLCGTVTTGTYNSNSISSLPSNRYIEKVNCDDKYMTVVNNGQEYTVIKIFRIAFQFYFIINLIRINIFLNALFVNRMSICKFKFHVLSVYALSYQF